MNNRGRYSNPRGRVLAVRNGPWGNRVPIGNEGEYEWGWQILSLGIMRPEIGNLAYDSRSVYAKWHEHKSEIGLLRAVSWDERIYKSERRKSYDGRKAAIEVPALLVSVPIKTVREWVDTFAELSVPVVDNVDSLDDIPIRSLAIDLDVTTQLFDKSWQALDRSHAVLNQRWEEIWREMSDVLENNLERFGLEWFDGEDERQRANIHYDLDGYDPHQFVVPVQRL